MLFILLLALILFGPKRLPEIARQVGKFVAEFKRASNDFKYQLQAEIDKASPAEQTPHQSSPIPTLPPPAETLPATSSAASQQAAGGQAGDPDSEHERLMRTARMAYQAQALALRPPEPPAVAQTVPSTATEPSTPAEPVSLTSTANAAPTGDSSNQGS